MPPSISSLWRFWLNITAGSIYMAYFLHAKKRTNLFRKQLNNNTGEQLALTTPYVCMNMVCVDAVCCQGTVALLEYY